MCYVEAFPPTPSAPEGGAGAGGTTSSSSLPFWRCGAQGTRLTQLVALVALVVIGIGVPLLLADVARASFYEIGGAKQLEAHNALHSSFDVKEHVQPARPHFHGPIP